MERENNNNLFADTGFNGTGTFRLSKAHKAAGYIFLAFSIVLFFLMSASEYEVIRYIFTAIFAMAGIYLLLLFYLTKVYVDSEKIVFYSFTGRKKELLWSDITSALIYRTYTRHSSQENIDLCTDNKKITVGEYFENYKSIKTIINRKCRRAFPAGKIKNGGTQVLRIGKNIEGLGICFIVFGVLVAAVSIAAAPALTSLAAAMLLCMQAPFILTGLALLRIRRVLRVYINAESITHINLFGAKKQITWPEIDSVTFYYGYTRLSRIMFSGGGKTIILNSYYLGFEAAADIVKKFCPEKATSDLLS